MVCEGITPMYDRILLTTDGSETAESATTHALAIATQFEAELHVLSIIDTEAMSRPFEADQVDWFKTSSSLDEIGLNDAARASMERITTEAEAAGLEVIQTVAKGDPHRAISDYATQHEIDLIAMGSRGHRGLRRLLVGSVTDRVTRTVSVPVLVTGDPTADRPALEPDVRAGDSNDPGTDPE